MANITGAPSLAQDVGTASVGTEGPVSVARDVGAAAAELEQQYRRVRWRLRFADPQTEADYRVWQARGAVPFTRAGMVASVVSMLAFVGAIVLARTPSPETLWGIAFVFANVAVALAMTARPALIRWVVPSTANANAVAGLVLVAVCARDFDVPEGAATTAIVVSFFGFTFFRIRPVMAIAAVTPYAALAQVILARAAAAGSVAWPTFVGFSSGLWIAWGGGLAACVTADIRSRREFRQERTIEAQRRSIELERRRADALLFNILPVPIAEELKASPRTIAGHFDEVTVLFADIVGFTPLAARMPAGDLVMLLNEVFSRFDLLVAELGVEKIKTIGDAYMAAAGLPTPRADHAIAAAELALGMKASVEEYSHGRSEPIALRIGLCTGPAVAGVIGSRKFAYDLWGETVNMAARMESHGVAGEIQVAATTYRALVGRYELERRGAVDVKGVGPVETWLLRGRASPLKADTTERRRAARFP